jgi:hypothetical protein
MLFRDDNLPIILVFAAKIQRFPTKGGRNGHYNTRNNDRSLITAIVHQERSVSQELATCRILSSELE